MAYAMVSVSMGVMSPLLRKLTVLLEKEYSKLKSVRDEILFLKNELSSMHAFLEKLADMDDLDVQVKEWRNQVRDLSYDIEDCIDDFMLRVDHGSDIKKGFFQKSIQKLKTLGARHDVAQQIRKLKDRVGDVSERRARYNFDGAISSSGGVVPIDPRLTALYAEAKHLVGMDGPKDEVIKLLTEGEGELVQKLRVVSIWGFGGLGKTTLANQVYHQLKGQFECEAFVSVSQKPSMISVLRKVLLQVKGHQSVTEYEVKDIIDELRNHLLDKRYFVIIDDLWDESAWRVLRCAFPENKHGSRVITTTRIEPLARSCCNYHPEYIYKMRSLNDQDSRRLFFNRIFGSEDACPSSYKEVSAKILKKCAGLPLAIITIASILASQATEQKVQWKYVQNSLDTMIEDNLTWKGMRQILNLSYINLPRCLKTCFLYLGIYPEDYSIEKDDLISRWVAEGFVGEVPGLEVEDVAESYFNELVNRSMIQIEGTNYDNVMTCRVHDMMLDIIIHKSRDENFLTIMDDTRDITGPCYKVRRLSLHFGYGKHGMIPTTVNVSQVRSLATFTYFEYICRLPLTEFKFIQVLILHIMDVTLGTVDLTGMCVLFHLRCFKVKLGARLELLLPSQIRRLQNLETFEIRMHPDNQSYIDIPSDIVYLPRLLHLIIPRTTKLPNGIGNMKSLRTLLCLGLNKILPEHIQSLAELTSLRYLHISHRDTESFADMAEYVDVFCSSLRKIGHCNLKYLSVNSSGRNICCDGLIYLSPSPRHLQILQFRGWWFSRVPKWMSELHDLKSLELKVRNLLKDDVHILAQLPALVNLQLLLRSAPKERIVICGTGFPVLNCFTIICERTCLVFEAAAMPKLESLQLFFGLRDGYQYVPHVVGIEHLPCLKEIYAKLCGFPFPNYETTIKTESALRNAIDMHPNHPRVKIHPAPWNWEWGLSDDEDEEEDG